MSDEKLIEYFISDFQNCNLKLGKRKNSSLKNCGSIATSRLHVTKPTPNWPNKFNFRLMLQPTTPTKLLYFRLNWCGYTYHNISYSMRTVISLMVDQMQQSKNDICRIKRKRPTILFLCTIEKLSLSNYYVNFTNINYTPSIK